MNLLKRTKQEVCTCNVKDMEKTIDKFTDEQEMLDAYINGEYTAKEIVSVFLPDDVKEQYKIYCSEKNLQDTEETAAAFLGWWYEEDSDREPTAEELLDDEEMSEEVISNGYQDVFSEWNKDITKLTELSSSESARVVTLWRWENPVITDKQKCASETGVPIADVEKWWCTPDWINGYVGGHFHPTNLREMNKKELKSFLIEACRKTLEA